MLDKLKIAVVLLIIGSLSGLLIWGANELTVDRIEENRERARLAVYVDMFPDVDINRMAFEDIENSSVIEKITMYDSNGNLLGYALRGRQTNAFGFVNVVLGVDRNNNIINVVITDTDNTPTYYQPLVSNYFPNFKSQDIRNVSYDTSTGATSTYNSVRTIIEDAKLLVAGDTILEAYQAILEDTERYEILFEFSDESYDIEYVLYNSDDERIGYAYHAEVNDHVFAMVVDTNDVFKGLVGIDHSELDSAFSAFDHYLDEAIEDINVDVSGETELLIAAIFEDIQTLLTTSFHAEADYLVRYMEVFDNDTLVGYAYIGRAQGFNGYNVVKVTINLDGELTELETLVSPDTQDYYGDVFSNFEGFYGITELEESDAIDVYAGATASGRSLFRIVSHALSYHAERLGE